MDDADAGERPGFDYANVTGRPAGTFVSVAARVLPGVELVQRQIPLYASQWRAANLAALSRPGPRWIVFGDSMSQGVGASRFDAGWVNQVQARLAADGLDYAVVNLSASGARIEDVLLSQIPAWRNLPAAPVLPAAPHDQGSDRPDLVTVVVGSNDLMRKQYRDAMVAGFTQLLEQLPAGAIVANLPNPRRVAVAVNALIDRAQAQHGLVVADTRGGRVSWKGRLAEDHFHPNELGYAHIASVFYDAISARAARPESLGA